MKKYLLAIDRLGTGGAERQISFLAIELKKAGNDVRLLQFYEGVNHYGIDLDEFGIKVETFTQGRNGIKRAILLGKLIKNWKPDCVICYKEGSSKAGCIARMFMKFKLVVSERNTTQMLNLSERIKFFLFRFADYIVPNSYSQSNFIRKQYPNLSSKIRVITNMLDSEKYSPKEINHTENNPLRIVTTARISPQKNVFKYLEAIRIIKDRSLNCVFDWYGDPVSKKYLEQVISQTETLGISDLVTFHSANANVISIYRTSDIFILPSLYEGFPNALCEAMSCGVPAIASNVNDSPIILRNSRFLVDPNDAYDIAEKIEDIVNLSTSERKNIGNQNRLRISELCSPSKFLNSYTSL